MSHIRVLAACVFRCANDIPVGTEYDPVANEHFFRLLGGSIETVWLREPLSATVRR